MSGATRLSQTVIQGGYCIGCGACAAVEDSPFRIALDAMGRYQASADPASAVDVERSVAAVCPFADQGPHEDAIAEELHGASCQRDSRIGYYLANYAGYVEEGHFRGNGSSGGIVSWLCVELFRRGLVDAVIHVKPRSPSDKISPLFAMSVSRSEEEIVAGAKSRYYPIEMSHVLREVRQTPGRYAVVGLPCFIKAVRRLALQEPLFQERIVFCIGLVCGHLKSACFADMLAWQFGILPGELAAMDFRRKIAGAPASDYGIQAAGSRDADSRSEVRGNGDLYGYNWGYGFFKYNACDYCDDVLAETADVAVGDAWLPQYVQDSDGTNVVVVRHGEIDVIIAEAVAAGRLKLDCVSAETIAESQDGGLRHRREGLAYRLRLKDRARQWRPRKRVTASETHLTAEQKKIQKCRMQLAAQSHIAFHAAKQAGRFQVFQQQMDPSVLRYAASYRAPLWRRAIGRLRRVVRGLIRSGNQR